MRKPASAGFSSRFSTGAAKARKRIPVNRDHRAMRFTIPGMNAGPSAKFAGHKGPALHCRGDEFALRLVQQLLRDSRPLLQNFLVVNRHHLYEERQIEV